MSAGRTGLAKAMVNKSGLRKIKKNMNKATIYRAVVDPRLPDLVADPLFRTQQQHKDIKIMNCHRSAVSIIIIIISATVFTSFLKMLIKLQLSINFLLIPSYR